MIDLVINQYKYYSTLAMSRLAYCTVFCVSNWHSGVELGHYTTLAYSLIIMSGLIAEVNEVGVRALSSGLYVQLSTRNMLMFHRCLLAMLAQWVLSLSSDILRM